MESVTCHAYKLEVNDNFRESGQACLHLWCLDRNSHPVRLRVEDFPHFCFMELPQFVDGRPKQWVEGDVNLLLQRISAMLSADAPTEWALVQRAKLYYDRGGKTYPMVMLNFRSQNAMRHCHNLVKKNLRYGDLGTVVLRVWEDTINIFRKFFTNRRCRYAQWFTVQGTVVSLDDRLSVEGTTEAPIREYTVAWDTLQPLAPEITKGWVTFPRLLAIDIETYSNNHRALPNALDPSHQAYMISAIYQRLGDPSSRRKFGLIIGACDPIEGVEIISVKGEIALGDALATLIQRLDPEIITGYNIMGYDIPYLNTRRMSRMRDWPVMGRTIGEIATVSTRSWKSSAYGHNSIHTLEMSGRINVDMLPIVRREHKLDKYTLDFVCRHFLQQGKHDVSAPEMFTIFEKMKGAVRLNTIDDPAYRTAVENMTRVMAYCVQDSELVIDLFQKLNVWIGLLELSSIVGVSVTDIFTRGQQVRCQSQLYDLAHHSNIVLDSRTTPRMFFNGGYVKDPIVGLHRRIICLDFASLYPSIIEADNICFTTLIPPEHDAEVPDAECNIIEFDQDEPIGGKVKRQDGDEGPVDGASDGESSSEDENGSPKPKEIRRHYRFKFRKAAIKRGLLPQLVHSLVAERNVVRQVHQKTIKKQLALLKPLMVESACPEEALVLFPDGYDFARVKDVMANLELQYVVLDKRQNALKVSANSMFGFLGAQNGGLLPLIEGAMCITARGRELINSVNTYLIETYGAKIVYNDTDSSMIDLNLIKSEECEEWGKRLMVEISGAPEKRSADGTVTPAVKGLFPPPLRMEFEKAMDCLLCLKKKKYAATLLKADGTLEMDNKGHPKLLTKGIVLARRDNPQLLRNIYTELLQMVLTGGSIEAGFNHIISNVADLIQGKVPAQGNLTIIRELGSDYVNANYFMKVFSDELRRLGKPVNPGDRLEYVIVKTQAELEGQDVVLGKKMRSIEAYTESPDEPIDYVYYLEHVLMNPLDQLFSIGFAVPLSPFKEVGYTPQYSHCHFAGVATPVRMLAKMIVDLAKGGHTLTHIGDHIRNNLGSWFRQYFPQPRRRLVVVKM